MTNRIGDRPQFPLSNQRFDKGDANNISRYYEEIISRFTGSIYGQAWGCMSNPQFEVGVTIVPPSISLPYIRPKRCVLMYSMPADGTDNFQFDDKGPWNATIVQFDPARAGQPVVTLQTSAAFSAGQRPWILFRRNETDTNVGNKAFWDTSNNTEEVGAAPLQRSEYVEFRLSASYSSSDRSAGWHRCAYIDSWGTPGSSLTPVIVPIHWMDSLFYNQTTPPVQGTRVGMAFAHPSAPAAVYETGFDPTRDMPGLGKLMHWVTGKLGQHYSTTNVRQLSGTAAGSVNLKDGAFTMVNDADGGWLSTPPRGLVELDSSLTNVTDSTIPALQNSVTALDELINLIAAQQRTTIRLLHTLFVVPVPGTPAWNWDNYTFAVTLGASSADLGFSPTIALAPTVAQLQYKFTPIASDYNEESGEYMTKEIIMELLCPALPGQPNFIMSAVQIVGSSRAGVKHIYSTIAPNAIPPSTAIKLTFDFKSDIYPIITSFTVYIYGRNV